MTGYEIAQEQIKQFKEYQNNPYADYVVSIEYKYDNEDTYTQNNEVVWHSPLDNMWWWNNDWCEGQTDVIVNGIIAVHNIPKEVFKTEKEIKK